MDFGPISRTNDLQLTCSEVLIWGGGTGGDRGMRGRKKMKKEILMLLFSLRACLSVQVECI